MNAKLPGWLRALLTEAPAEKKRTTEPVVILDRDVAHDRGARYLRDHAPLAIEGHGGDATTYKVAANLRDLGVLDPLHCLELMQEHWNERCTPPWSAPELKEKVEHAYRYGQNAPGSAAPEADFEPILSGLDAEYGRVINEPAAPDAAATKPRFHVRHCGEYRAKLSHQWLIDGVLPVGGLVVMAAKWNEGKTFNAIDMAMAAARNIPWQGRKSGPASVLYVSVEGDLGNRLIAYGTRNSVDLTGVPFYTIEDSCNLQDANADLKPLITQAREIPGLGLIVLDTLARVMVGGDENSGQDMSRLVAHAGQIQRATGATVMFIHHYGKDDTRGARGHSSLMGAVDTALGIKNGVITVDKQRDGQRGAKFGFRLVPVEIGQDDDGRPVTSCIVEPIAAGEMDKKAPRAGSNADKALTVLEDITVSADPDGERSALWEQWRDEFCRLHYADERKNGWNALARAAKDLADLKRIYREGDRVVLL